VEFGVSHEQQADNQVAKLLAKHGVRPERGSGQTTARTIRLWRNGIAAGHDNEAAIIYANMFSDDERQRFSVLPSDQARRVEAINLLSGFIRAVFPRPKKRT
jgi:hypothetical protein